MTTTVSSLDTTALVQLQQYIKRDSAGYRDEFAQQWRHYESKKALFLMSPQTNDASFQSLVMFMAQVQDRYTPEVVPQDSFRRGIESLLMQHGPLLEHSTRLTLVKALILMRNKNVISSSELLPVLFSLFPIHDKALRQLMSRHIAADIKGANKKGRNEQFNRKVQNILLPIVEQEDEVCAKRALAVFTDMWRRQVWRDAKTANGIAAAAFHPSTKVMVASLKFFMGQDEMNRERGEEDDDDDDDDDDDGGGDTVQNLQPTNEEVYKAFHKGTLSSKKKKQKKLKRAMQSMKKAIRREEGKFSIKETFAAIHLLHDPQGFAEKLFAKMKSNIKSETRMLMMSVVSRVIGVHQLLLLNFYPFIQKYISPSRQDITSVLAALIQACHDQVPPETLAPVLRQLVDQFIHDRARPEVITVGIKTVREICLRTPLVMTPELLQELVEYRKYRDKEVATVARALLGLFREVAPSMLKKKDRGRGTISIAKDVGVCERVDGAELLPSDDGSDDGDEISDDGDESNDDGDESNDDGDESSDDGDESSDSQQNGDPSSLRSLKKQMIECSRILTQEDFAKIKALKRENMVEEVLQKHGLKSIKKTTTIHEQPVNPNDLLGKRRGRADKEERLASVMQGREDREFGAKARIKNKKTGGLSNREKQKRKNLPMGAVSGQVRKRLERNKLRSAKNFKGHVRK
jgi:protein SDA1